MNRLNELKVLKMMGEAHDPSSKGCYTCSSNVSVLIPYDERLLKDPNRQDMFKGDNIRSLVGISESVFSPDYITAFLKHYQRKDDVIRFFMMAEDGAFPASVVEQVNAPVMMSCNAEWFYLVAPRVEEDYLERNTPVLHPIKTFNPITGDFE